MDSIKWKCKNWIVYFKNFYNFHLIHLIIEKSDVFNFHPIFSIASLISHSRARFEHVFYKISKVEILQRRKTRLWKMSAKLNILNSVRSFWLCRETNRPSGMSCPLCVETKMKKTKVWKECQINFRFFQTDIFEWSSVSNVKTFFQLTPEILKFQLLLN